MYATNKHIHIHIHSILNNLFSPQSQRPIICYVCRQPGHLASKCPSSANGQFRSKSNNNDSNDN